MPEVSLTMRWWSLSLPPTVPDGMRTLMTVAARPKPAPTLTATVGSLAELFTTGAWLLLAHQELAAICELDTSVSGRSAASVFHGDALAKGRLDGCTLAVVAKSSMLTVPPPPVPPAIPTIST